MANPDIKGWRLKKQRYSLIGEVCLDCDTKIFPPRAVCPGCAVGGAIEIINVTTDFAKVEKESALASVR